MCPLCITTAAIAAGSVSGAGVLGFVAFKFRTLRRQRRAPSTSQRSAS